MYLKDFHMKANVGKPECLKVMIYNLILESLMISLRGILNNILLLLKVAVNHKEMFSLVKASSQ